MSYPIPNEISETTTVTESKRIMKKFFPYSTCYLSSDSTKRLFVCFVRVAVCLLSIFYYINFFWCSVCNDCDGVSESMVFGLRSPIFYNIFSRMLTTKDLEQFLLPNREIRVEENSKNHFLFGCPTVKLNFIYIIRVQCTRSTCAIFYSPLVFLHFVSWWKRIFMILLQNEIAWKKTLKIVYWPLEWRKFRSEQFKQIDWVGESSTCIASIRLVCNLPINFEK